MKKGYSKLIAARREKIKQSQLRKEGNWMVSRKNGKKMVKENTDSDAVLDPTTRSISASISFARSRGQTHASRDYGHRPSYENFTSTRDQYVTKKDYEKPVLEQPGSTRL
jgi:tRNA nucleotidyltransferase (CCA-adding enzyme)